MERYLYSYGMDKGGFGIMSATKDGEILQDLQEKYFNLMRDYAELLVYLQNNASLTYQAYLNQKAKHESNN